MPLALHSTALACLLWSVTVTCSNADCGAGCAADAALLLQAKVGGASAPEDNENLWKSRRRHHSRSSSEVESDREETKERFLPLKLDGVAVLKEIEKGVYQADNEALQSDRKAIGYRMSKLLNDLDERTGLRWGEKVHGVDAGDGWIQVDLKETSDRYLPMQVQGVPVLEVVEDGVYRATNDFLDSDQKAVGFRLSKDVADVEDVMGLRWGEKIHGIDVGGGWIKVQGKAEEKVEDEAQLKTQIDDLEKEKAALKAQLGEDATEQQLDAALQTRLDALVADDEFQDKAQKDIVESVQDAAPAADENQPEPSVAEAPEAPTLRRFEEVWSWTTVGVQQGKEIGFFDGQSEPSDGDLVSAEQRMKLLDQGATADDLVSDGFVLIKQVEVEDQMEAEAAKTQPVEEGKPAEAVETKTKADAQLKIKEQNKEQKARDVASEKAAQKKKELEEKKQKNALSEQEQPATIGDSKDASEKHPSLEARLDALVADTDLKEKAQKVTKGVLEKNAKVANEKNVAKVEKEKTVKLANEKDVAKDEQQAKKSADRAKQEAAKLKAKQDAQAKAKADKAQKESDVKKTKAEIDAKKKADEAKKKKEDEAKKKQDAAAKAKEEKQKKVAADKVKAQQTKAMKKAALMETKAKAHKKGA